MSAATALKSKPRRFDPTAPLQVFEWDTSAHDFQSIYTAHLKDAVGCPDIERYHEYLPAERMPKDPIEGTAHTYGHDLLYAIDPAFRQAGFVTAKDRGFIATYRRLMRFVQDEVFGEPIIFQRLPSLRIHYPGYTSYGVMHTDREYNHPAEEINLWMPITRCGKTATMVIESAIGRGDYAPVNLDYGTLLIFDSALMHGNRVNEEGYTRMSFDMRVIPQRIWRDARGTFSATAGKEFTLGQYYDRFED